MANQAKGPVIFLILLVILTLFTTGLGYLALQKEKQNNSELSKKIKGLEDEKRLVEEKIAGLTQQLDEARKSLSDSQAQVASINEQLTAEQKAKEEALASINQVKNELAQAVGVKADLEQRLKASEEKFSSTQKELEDLKSTKEGLEKKLKDLESKNQSVQLDRIVVSGQAEPGVLAAETQAIAQDQLDSTPTPVAIDGKLEGKVLVVNEEYDFIVVNMGRKDNIDVGAVLDIFHKNKKIGRAKIEEARETMSVAAPETKGLIKQVKEEDKVLLVR